MKNRKASLLACAFCAIALGRLGALEPSRFFLTLDARAWASLTVGVEAPIGATGLNAIASLCAPIPRLFSGDLDSWKAEAGVSSRLSSGSGSASVGWRTALTLSSTAQDLGAFLQLGSSVSVRPAWNIDGFSAGVSFTWEQGLLTKYSPSDKVFDTFADRPAGAGGSPADGWFAWGATTLLAGPDLRFSSKGLGSWRCAGGLRLSPGSLVEFGEGFPIGEWPFWFEFGWSYP